MYADIIVDISAEKIDRPFTYEVPDELENKVTVGTAVLIPFGSSNKLRKGYVTDLHNNRPKAGFEIKKIDSISNKQADTEEEFIGLAAWMKDRYGCTMNRALNTVLPVKRRIRKKKGIEYRGVVGELSNVYKLHEPNEEQAEAIKIFNNDFDNGIRNTYLLYGVTGSGKTDVYLHLMEHVIKAGKKVILLIPEISLTYQSIDRLVSVFKNRVAVIHSKLSDGEKYDQFRRCMDGDADIIVGPRSAVFAPLKNIGLIIIDEEHDGAYKNENVPRYNTIDVVRKRAENHGASIILSSATPSPDSYMRAQTGEYRMLRLSKRAITGAKLPKIHLIDMREEMLSGNRSIFSSKLNELITDRLSKKEQIILFMNRRGYSNFVSCRSCGNAVRCPHCDVTLTVHRGKRLICHYCGYEIQMPSKCPECGSPYIAEFGTGTEKLETMTKKMFPKARVARLDTDMTTAKKASEQILSDMASGKTDILIGTQMVVKGHDFPNVTLVGIMAADTSLYVSNYDSAERTFELITQASGRAGRADKEGDVVIQTYKPEHYAIDAALRQDYDYYFSNEITYRKLMKYPPASHLWSIQLSSKDESALNNDAESLVSNLTPICEKYKAQIIGPANASVYKVNDYYRKLIYVKNSEYDILLKVKNEADKYMGFEDTSVVFDFV